mgnify:CR=1 FL=1
MAEIIRMPKLSDTMTEGVVAEWHKNIGDEVESGELLAEIETDKATMEFESFQDGVLLHIGVEKGGTAPVDSVLCVLGEKGEDIAELLASAEAEYESLRLREVDAEKERVAAAGVLEGVREQLVRWERDLAVADERAVYADRRLAQIDRF